MELVFRTNVNCIVYKHEHNLLRTKILADISLSCNCTSKSRTASQRYGDASVGFLKRTAELTVRPEC